MITIRMKKSIAESHIAQLYSDTMKLLQNGYSDEEVKTFPYKKAAAEAVVSGTATDQQKYFLAHRKGFVNEAVPGSDNYMAAIKSEVEGMTAEQSNAVLADAKKIIESAYSFEHYSSLIEAARDSAISELSDTGDNTGAVDSLRRLYSDMIQNKKGA